MLIDIVKQLFYRFGGTFFSFISQILLVRVYGASFLGDITLVVSSVGILSVLTDLGISNAIKKFIASEEKGFFIFNAFVLKLILLLLFVIANVILCHMSYFDFQNMNLKMYWCALLCISISIIADLFTSIYQANKNFTFLGRIGVISSLFGLIITVFCCLFPTIGWLLVIVPFVLDILIFITGIYHYRRFISPFDNKFVIVETKRILKFSHSLIFSSIISRLFSYLDKIVISWMFGKYDLGLYQIANTLYAKLDVVVKTVTTTIYPFIINNIVKKKHYLNYSFRLLVSWFNILSVFIFLILILISKDLLQILYQIQNDIVVLTFQLLCLEILCKLLWRPYLIVLQGLNKHHLVNYFSIFSCFYRVGIWYILFILKDFINLGIASFPLTEFIIWFSVNGLISLYSLRNNSLTVFTVKIICKIWLSGFIIIIFMVITKFNILLYPLYVTLYLIILYFNKPLSKRQFLISLSYLRKM